MNKFFYSLKRLKEEKFSIKFIISRLILRANINIPFRIFIDEDIKIYLHPTSISCTLWINKEKKIKDVLVIKNFIKPDYICLDIGSNIGYLSLIMAKQAKNGLIIAIEPGRRIYQYLTENINLNDFKNIIPLNIAISRKDQIVDFFEYYYGDNFSSLIKIKNFPHKHFKTMSLSLKTLMKVLNLDKVDFLKIDVEGAEFEAIKSLGKFLNKVRYIYFEFNEKNFENFGYKSDDLINLLRDNQFSIYEILINENKKINLNLVKDFKDDNFLAINNNWQD